MSTPFPLPWEMPIAQHELVDGSEILDETVRILRRYLVLPRHAAGTIALWVMFAHAIDAFDVAPLLVFSSEQKRCGKTRTLSLVRELVPDPISTSNISAAAIFRVLGDDERMPTLLIDEGDTFVRGNEALRGILNAGHTRSAARVLRAAPRGTGVEEYSTWCPKVLALIGSLPSTIQDRAIDIPMRRRAPSEAVERVRLDRVPDELAPLKARARHWVEIYLPWLSVLDRPVPEDLNDRAQDNWRPLITIADICGGTWPELARQAAQALSGNDIDDGDDIAVVLLKDTWDVFERTRASRLETERLLHQLGKLENRHWTSFENGEPLDALRMSRLLRPYGVRSHAIRFRDRVKRGYRRSDVHAALAKWAPDAVQPPLHPKLRCNSYTSGRAQAVGESA